MKAFAAINARCPMNYAGCRNHPKYAYLNEEHFTTQKEKLLADAERQWNTLRRRERERLEEKDFEIL